MKMRLASARPGAWCRTRGQACIALTLGHVAGLLDQVIKASARHAVPLAGENALQRYDRYAFDRIAESAFGQNARAGHLVQLTFLRMGDLMFDNWDAFAHFVQRLHGAGSTGWRTC